MKFSIYISPNGYHFLIAKGVWPKSKLGALKASIKKWEFSALWFKRNPRKSFETGGTSTCALCKLYYKGVSHCDGCPVKEKTGKSCCGGTPIDICRHDEACATAEVEFLKSLLPTKRRK